MNKSSYVTCPVCCGTSEHTGVRHTSAGVVETHPTCSTCRGVGTVSKFEADRVREETLKLEKKRSARLGKTTEDSLDTEEY